MKLWQADFSQLRESDTNMYSSKVVRFAQRIMDTLFVTTRPLFVDTLLKHKSYFAKNLKLQLAESAGIV
ncbi:MAG: hypothetical protein Kow0065_07290 [Methylomicrobium sp.]